MMANKICAALCAVAGVAMVAGVVAFWETTFMIVWTGIVDAFGCAIAAAFFWFE